MTNTSRRNVIIVVILVAVVGGIIGIMMLGGPAATLAIFTGVGDVQESSGPVVVDNLAGSAGQTVFSIVADESEVRFIIDEELFNQPNPVTGRTNEIAGEIAVNFDDPASTEIGPIRINMRSILTDNEFRNRALRNRILLSSEDEFEFGEFVPTALEDMPETVAIGQPIAFHIIGDLTIRGVTQPVTFNATVTPVSETRLEGSATANVLYADFDMEIPSAPGVANISDDVLLEIDFVAVAGE